MSDEDQDLHVPPFPDPTSEVFALVIHGARDVLRRGGSVDEAITVAAVNAWYEGHIQGEDVCRGCDYRGLLPKQRRE